MNSAGLNRIFNMLIRHFVQTYKTFRIYLTIEITNIPWISSNVTAAAGVQRHLLAPV